MGCKQSRIVEEEEQNPFREPQQCHPPEIFRINQHTLDKFQCPIMWGVLNHPVKGNCGHIFCQKCIYSAFANDRRRRCPVCRQNLGKLEFDKKIHGEIEKLPVQCVHSECDWLGTLKQLETHLSQECKHEAPKCKLCAKTFENIIERDQHQKNQCPFRMITCIHCMCPIVATGLNVKYLLH